MQEPSTQGPPPPLRMDSDSQIHHGHLWLTHHHYSPNVLLENCQCQLCSPQSTRAAHLTEHFYFNLSRAVNLIEYVDGCFSSHCALLFKSDNYMKPHRKPSARGCYGTVERKCTDRSRYTESSDVVLIAVHA